MATRRIKFIGKTPYKKDNVCRTDLYWAFPGAICEAQEDIAVRLFAHPEVWVEADDDDEGLPESADFEVALSGNLTREDKVAIAIKIIEEEDALGEIGIYFYNNSDSVSGTSSDAAVDLTDGLANAGAEDSEKSKAVISSGANFSIDRNEAVIQAINLLDVENIEEHFTKEGVPRVEAIEGLLGYDITAQERTDAWDEIKSGVSESGGTE